MRQGESVFGAGFLGLGSASFVRERVDRATEARSPTLATFLSPASVKLVQRATVCGLLALVPAAAAGNATLHWSAPAQAAAFTRNAASAWSDYLASLSGLPRPQRVLTERLVQAVQALQPILGFPQAAPVADGVLQLVWDRGPHHFEIDALPEGLFEWFYRHRGTEKLAGGEHCTLPKSLRLPAQLERLICDSSLA